MSYSTRYMSHIHSSSPPGRQVLDACFNQTGSRLASASSDGTCVVYALAAQGPEESHSVARQVGETLGTQ